MKNCILIVLLVVAPLQSKVEDAAYAVIGGVVTGFGFGTLAGYLWGNNTAESSYQDSARTEIKNIQKDLIATKYLYQHELRLFATHGSCNTDEALRVVAGYLLTRNKSIDTYIHELSQKQQAMTHLIEMAQTTEQLWKNKENYQAYAQQLGQLTPEIMELKSKLDGWSKTIQREENFLKLKGLVETYKHTYAELHNIHQSVYGRREYEHQLAHFLQKLEPGKRFSLIAGVDILKKESQLLSTQMDKTRKNYNLNSYSVYQETWQESTQIKAVFDYALQVIESSDILRAQKIDEQHYEQQQRELYIQETHALNEKIRAQNERDLINTRFQEAHNATLALEKQNNELKLKILGHDKLVADHNVALDNNRALKEEVRDLRQDKQELKEENKKLTKKISDADQQVTELHKQMNPPPFNPAFDEEVKNHYDLITTAVSKLKETLKKN